MQLVWGWVFYLFLAVILPIFKNNFSITDAILCKYNSFFILVGTVEFNHIRIFFPIYGTVKSVNVQQVSS